MADLPRVWRERFEADFGPAARRPRRGAAGRALVLRAIGGAFQGYTLGNILSAQFYEQALKAHLDP